MSKSLIVRMSIATSVILLITNLAAAAGTADLAIFSGDREIRVSEASLFAGRSLDAGTYRLAWELTVGTDRVEIRLFRGKNLIYSAWGGVVAVESTFPYDSVGYTRDASGKLDLAEIRFAESRNMISLKNATLVASSERP